MGQARDLGERWFQTVRGGDADAIAAMLTDDVDFYTPVGVISSPQEAAGYLQGFAVALPDAQFNIRQWIEETPFPADLQAAISAEFRKLVDGNPGASFPGRLRSV